MKVGDIVVPTKESGFHLHSGCESYSMAIVISITPFILTSEDADMKWSATIKKEYFTVVGTADSKTLELCMRRL